MRPVIVLSIVFMAFSSMTIPQTKEKHPPKSAITFIELGSVNCIPCKKMQPVMKAIGEQYGERVRVVFYDVWTAEQKPMAQKYGIRLIPTQIFLDENGKEFFRHEGFFPEEEIHALFQKRGVMRVKAGG
jgi:thioredoxin 1